MDDSYAIRLAKTEQREGFNHGDADRILATFADAFIDMSAGSPSFYGAEARATLEYRLQRLFARYRTRLVVTIAAISVMGDSILDRGWHTLTLRPRAGGRPKTRRTRYLEIWRKQADGKWKIVLFVDNDDIAPRMPPREVMDSLRTGGSRLAPRRRSLKGAKSRA